jgi:hypothetical protein
MKASNGLIWRVIFSLIEVKMIKILRGVTNQTIKGKTVIKSLNFTKSLTLCVKI